MHLALLSSAFLLCAVLAEKDRPVLSNISVTLPTGFYYSELAPWLNELSIYADPPNPNQQQIITLSIEELDNIDSTRIQLKALANSAVAAITIKPSKSKYSIDVLEEDGELEVELNDFVILIHPIPPGLEHILELIGDKKPVQNIIKVMTMNKASSRIVFAAQIMNISNARNKHRVYKFIEHPNPSRQKK